MTELQELVKIRKLLRILVREKLREARGAEFKASEVDK